MWGSVDSAQKLESLHCVHGFLKFKESESTFGSNEAFLSSWGCRYPGAAGTLLPTLKP